MDLAVDTLEAQMRGTPLLRRVATTEDLAKPSAVHCFRAEAAAAARWFRERAGRAPESVVTLDGAWRKWQPLPERAADLQTLVHGERLRVKATRLAMQGHAELLYTSDPGFKQIRTAPDYLERHGTNIEKLWQSLEDRESRLVLAAILRQRTTGEHGYLRVSRFVEYCHPHVKAEAGDVVIDAGAFNGATSTAFARGVGRKGLVYAFEPSRQNRKLIRKRVLRPWNWRLRIEVVPAALSDSVGSGHFENERGGSGALRAKADEADDVEATDVTTLDHFARDGRKVDLISLDVEGAEPAVLAGARRLIGEQRPKLQISVYHSLPHLFEIPLQLLEQYPDYALFLGHHDVYSTETDAYLVPRERLGAP